MATQVADPSRVVKLANLKLDECRRRVSGCRTNSSGTAVAKHDPLYRARPLLTNADERLCDGGREKLMGLSRRRSPGRGDGHLADQGTRARAL